MSGSLNRVEIIGNLGADPEVRAMPSGDNVANLSVATSETWIDKASGEKKERTEWHRVTIFGKLADIAGEYLRKGSKVYLAGQLQTRKWQDQAGQDRYSTEIVLRGFNSTMLMLDGKPAGESERAATGSSRRDGPPADTTRPERKRPPAELGRGDRDFDDDIPF